MKDAVRGPSMALHWKCLFLVACALPFFACNQLVSVGQDSMPGDGNSTNPRVSADGRFVAFSSAASNLVAGDMNGGSDVFVRDRSNGTTERISVKQDGTQAACCSEAPAISGNGRFVAFSSTSPDLGVPAGSSDVLVRDRMLGTTQRVAQGTRPEVSADGRIVAVLQQAALPLSGVGKPLGRPVVFDLERGTTDTLEFDFRSPDLSLSADGRFVAFSDCVLIPTSRVLLGCGVRVLDRVSRVMDIVADTRAGFFSRGPSLSADGQTVAFESNDVAVVPGDTNGSFDVFVRDRLAGTTTRISASDSGEQGNNGSQSPSISADGDRVVYSSFASNLVAGDTNGLTDSFVYVRSRALTRRISIADDGTPGNAESDLPAISSDGRISVYSSKATNLSGFVDTGSTFDVFAKPVDEVIPPPQGSAQ